MDLRLASLAVCTFLLLLGSGLAHPSSDKTADDDDDDAPTTGESNNSVLEVAQLSPELSNLAQVLHMAGLAETLQAQGPFTLFAPKNEAFLESCFSPLWQDPQAMKINFQQLVVSGIITVSITGTLYHVDYFFCYFERIFSRYVSV